MNSLLISNVRLAYKKFVCKLCFYKKSGALKYILRAALLILKMITDYFSTDYFSTDCFLSDLTSFQRRSLQTGLGRGYPLCQLQQIAA